VLNSGILETTIPRKSVYELPGGKMAKIVHKGSYAKCSPTYEKLFSWIAEKELLGLFTRCTSTIPGKFCLKRY